MQTFREWLEHANLSKEAEVAWNSIFQAAVEIKKHMDHLKGKQIVPQEDVYGLSDHAQKIYSALINLRDETKKELARTEYLEAIGNRVYYAIQNLNLIISDMKSNPERYGDMAQNAVKRLGGNGHNQTVQVAGTPDSNHSKDMYTELTQLTQKIRSMYDQLEPQPESAV